MSLHARRGLLNKNRRPVEGDFAGKGATCRREKGRSHHTLG